ncbi:hypothetical protein D3C72_1693240 [compost metagenome]
MAVPVVVHPKPDAVAWHQIGKILETVDQQFLDVRVMGGEPQEAVESGMGVVDGIEFALLLKDLQMHGEKLSKHFCGDPD